MQILPERCSKARMEENLQTIMILTERKAPEKFILFRGLSKTETETRNPLPVLINPKLVGTYRRMVYLLGDLLEDHSLAEHL
jgi:hypothetical protein